MSEINDTKEIPEGTFPINLKPIKEHQRLEPTIKAKYKDGTYQQGYLCGGSNINLKLITCKDKIVIPSKLQSYIVHWCQMYLVYPGIDITDAMICKHWYWPNIIYDVRK